MQWVWIDQQKLIFENVNVITQVNMCTGIAIVAHFLFR